MVFFDCGGYVLKLLVLEVLLVDPTFPVDTRRSVALEWEKGFLKCIFLLGPGFFTKVGKRIQQIVGCRSAQLSLSLSRDALFRCSQYLKVSLIGSFQILYGFHRHASQPGTASPSLHGIVDSQFLHMTSVTGD